MIMQDAALILIPQNSRTKKRREAAFESQSEANLQPFNVSIMSEIRLKRTE
jgi:hypothetical protein